MMMYPLNPPLMDLLILSTIVRNDSYGYEISQQLKKVSNLKDSTLYPILRRLSESGCMEVYDQQFQGRNRKYYSITETGKRELTLLKSEWESYTAIIKEMIDESHVPEGGKEHEEA